jgi:hypothetical protein
MKNYFFFKIIHYSFLNAVGKLEEIYIEGFNVKDFK